MNKLERVSRAAFVVGIVCCFSHSMLYAQSVCLPAPRLLTLMPMGGQVGTTIEVTISGEELDDVTGLYFSHDHIKATPKTDDNGNVIPNRFVVSIASNCPHGIHEARVMTRLGISTSRVFSVSNLTEVARSKANTSLETAMPLEMNSICNATMTSRAVDHYTFDARKGTAYFVDCAASGIDSKAKPVVIVADANGQDLVVERRGGLLKFSPEETGTYCIKVHDLTYNGGAYHFYRLALREGEDSSAIFRLPSTQQVNAFSWPPAGVTDEQTIPEIEPNNKQSEAHLVSLPCDITGSFYPAADVDIFEFAAKKGDVWWVEVASERLGRPTDPSVIVQRVEKSGENEKLIDVAEFTDIPSPVKVSSNGYSYDGPPYNAGSTDVLGKLEIKTDGVYRLKLLDLFGGTRNDPNNRYRLIVRRAQPDFAVVGWAMHMGLRNGDRNALSKPIAMRAGATMPIDVVVFRRDGFNGEIEFNLDHLPEGVTSTGMTIPAGRAHGTLLVSADESAATAFSVAKFTATSKVDDQVITRPCRMATMAWPVRNAWSEIPSPRLAIDIPVSVSDAEGAPLTITPGHNGQPATDFTIKAGEKVTIPLELTTRYEFSGTKISLKTFGAGFDRNPAFDVSLSGNSAETTLDTAALKVKPGDYTIAFYGSAVAKYRAHLASILLAETNVTNAKTSLEQFESNKDSVTDADAQLAQLEKALSEAEKQLNLATQRAKPKDIVDIVVSKPIRIRVLSADEGMK